MSKPLFRDFDNCANLNENIELLKEIFNNQTLRNDLEEFISQTYEVPLSCVDFSDDNFVKNIFINKINDFSKKYNIEPFAIEIYFSLDRTLFNSYSTFYYPFSKKLLSLLKLPINVSKTAGTSFICPYEFRSIFSKNKAEEIKFIFENMHLFPDSTQNFFEKKFLLRDNQPKLVSISNDFQYKMLFHSLNNDINIDQLNTFHNKFVTHSCSLQKLLSSFYFRKAVKEKYDLNKINNPLFDKFFKKQSNYIYSNIGNYFSESMNTTYTSDNVFFNVISFLKNDSDFTIECLDKQKKADVLNVLELDMILLHVFNSNSKVHDYISNHLHNLILTNISLFGFSLDENSEKAELISTFEYKWSKRFMFFRQNVAKLKHNGII